MKYAIVKSGGKQYKVKQGDILLLDRLHVAKDETFVFPEVLLLRSDEKTDIGSPYLAGVKVIGKVLDEVKGKKITISKFKAKVRYRRKMGFRPTYTKIKIESISEGIPAPRKSKTKAS